MNRKVIFLLLISISILGATVNAQDMMAPAVEVNDQVSLDGTVTIADVDSPEAGFIVIHADNGSGSFGAVIGHRAVNAGHNANVAVSIDTSMATTTLYAMLHTDTGEMGVYEFGTVEGADSPVIVDGAPVSPGFAVDIIHAHDQFVDGSVMIDSITAQVDGWIVIHADNEGRPGPVLGASAVSAGTTADVMVELEGDATSVLWPMLHVDTGAMGEYEFGTVEGADGPVRAGDQVAVTSIWTVPHVRVADQIIIHGDGMEMMNGMAPTLTAHTVLSEGAGFLVIHQDNGEGGPGPVIGFAPVENGTNSNVVIELDANGLTPVVFPMLHTDTGEAGVYEFGTVEGADGPVRVNDQVVVFPVNIAPSITYNGSLDGNVLTVEQAMIDAPGFLAIHSDGGEGPGPVLGAVPLLAGINSHITIELDEAMMTETVYPMLHYDTNEMGVYEFGTVEGADGPARVGGNVVVGALVPSMME